MTEQFSQPGNYIEPLQAPYWFFEAKLNYLLTEVMEELGIDNENDIATSLSRALRACDTLQLPISRNFRKVFRSEGHQMKSDWEISPVACYLLVINCNPTYESVAKAQLYFALNRVAHG